MDGTGGDMRYDLKAKVGNLVDFGSQNPIFAFKMIKIDLFLAKTAIITTKTVKMRSKSMISKGFALGPPCCPWSH